MIVRISTEGQYRLPDEDADRPSLSDRQGRREGSDRQQAAQDSQPRHSRVGASIGSASAIA